MSVSVSAANGQREGWQHTGDVQDCLIMIHLCAMCASRQAYQPHRSTEVPNEDCMKAFF